MVHGGPNSGTRYRYRYQVPYLASSPYLLRVAVCFNNPEFHPEFHSEFPIINPQHHFVKVKVKVVQIEGEKVRILKPPSAEKVVQHRCYHRMLEVEASSNLA